MTQTARAMSVPDPLASYTLNALLEGASGLRPDGLAMVEAGSHANLTFAALQELAARFAHRLLEMGVVPGQTIIVLGANRMSTLVSLLGAVHAGVHIALPQPTLRADQVAQLGLQLQAAALICEDEIGDIDLLEKGFVAAALSDCVRMVGALAPGRSDAADFSLEALAQDVRHPVSAPVCISEIITLELRAARLIPVRHSQHVLVAAALNLIARAGLTATAPLLSTLAPHSFAGLVAGPMSALLCGAPLHLHGLFDARTLLAQLAAAPQAQLILPAALVPALASTGILAAPAVSGIVALSRWAHDAANFAPPHIVAGTAPIIDLHAFGERALVPEPRKPDGTPRALLDPAHEIEIGGTRLIAVDADPTHDDALQFFGAAVSTGE